MSFTHTISRSYKGYDNSVALTETPTADFENNLDRASLAIAANTLIVWKQVRANLKSIVIQASGPITIYTNAASGGSPTDTIALVANQALIWTLATDGLAKCPFSADVTAGLYCTNAGAGAVTLKIRALTA